MPHVEKVTCSLLTLPSSPALVEELAPTHQPSRQIVRTVREHLARLAPTRIVVVYQQSEREYTAHAGSFAAWGAPSATVSAGHYLPELVARYVLGPKWEPAIVDCQETLQPCEKDTLYVVMVDGSAGLTARAPLALVDGGDDADSWCAHLLGSGQALHSVDAQWLSDRGVLQPEPWLMVDSFAQTIGEENLTTTMLEHDTTLGVGRYVAHWDITLSTAT